jgi:hypothetical protein
MRTSALIGVLVVALVLSIPAQADEHVLVIYGQRGNAVVVSGGPKSDASWPSYGFLRAMPPVDSSALQAWLGQAYVETDLYAGFVEPAARDGNVWPNLASTHWGIRVDLAAGGSFNAFVYDKFATYARASLAAPNVSVGDLAAACHVLHLVSGLSEEDRLLLCTRIDELFAADRWDIRAAAVVLDEAVLTPSTAIRAALQEKAHALAGAIGTPVAADVLELARLHRLLGEDSGITSDAIRLAVLSLAGRGGGFRADVTVIDSDLVSTLYAVQALELIGRAADLDAEALQVYVLDCWDSPGFAPIDAASTADTPGATLHATFAGTEILAILRNRGVP